MPSQSDEAIKDGKFTVDPQQRQAFNDCLSKFLQEQATIVDEKLGPPAEKMLKYLEKEIEQPRKEDETAIEKIIGEDELANWSEIAQNFGMADFGELLMIYKLFNQQQHDKKGARPCRHH